MKEKGGKYAIIQAGKASDQEKDCRKRGTGIYKKSGFLFFLRLYLTVKTENTGGQIADIHFMTDLLESARLPYCRNRSGYILLEKACCC